MIGVIDIGSNSVRLLVRDKSKTVFKNNIITQLALGLSDGLLQSDSIKRTVDAVVFFVEKAKSFRCEKIFAFGTAALRSAKNSFVFTELVKAQTGIDVEIISGDKEALLGLKGVLSDKEGAILDIGGASTEIIVSNGQEVIYSKSLNVGAVSLNDRCGQDQTRLKNYISGIINEYGIVPKANVFGIGGTITSVASMLQGLTEYDADKINGYKITVFDLVKLKDEFFALSEEERYKIKGLQKKRVGVIGGGMVLLYEIMRYLNIDFITASDNDNLEGYLIEKGLYE